uniref:Uncharacterized protein n=1 Tax=Meloidogyne enterolobii TaxID=390850 RepID=A0A6V7UXT2_MELEN|nr:unnamed protein product [Meloidogyne enterolobii]
MPKNKIIATPIKNAIVSACRSGRRANAVALDFNLSKSTVSKIIKLHRDCGDLHRNSSRGKKIEITGMV